MILMGSITFIVGKLFRLFFYHKGHQDDTLCAFFEYSVVNIQLYNDK